MLRNTKTNGEVKIYLQPFMAGSPVAVESTLLLDDMSVLSILDSSGAVIQTIDLSKIIDHHCERDCIDADLEPVSNSPNVCMCPVDTLMSVGCKCYGV